MNVRVTTEIFTMRSSFNESCSQVEAYGKANLIEPIKPTPDTVFSICYTSVRDQCFSLPPSSLLTQWYREQLMSRKVTVYSLFRTSCLCSLGVVWQHKNLAMATCAGLHGVYLPDDGSMMSYLPLAHAYEVSCH